MRRGTYIFAAAYVTIVTEGCALVGIDPGVRSLVISHRQFNPPDLEVPVGKPFTLLVDAVGYRAVSISSTDLGIEHTVVRASRPHPIGGRYSAPFDISKRVRISLGPLPPGKYKITCDCDGNQPVATLSATGQKGDGR